MVRARRNEKLMAITDEQHVRNVVEKLRAALRSAEILLERMGADVGPCCCEYSRPGKRCSLCERGEHSGCVDVERGFYERRKMEATG